jgi:hypothetical protein
MSVGMLPQSRRLIIEQQAAGRMAKTIGKRLKAVIPPIKYSDPDGQNVFPH